MKVGVLGSGEVGKRLAGGFAARQHDVVLGTRNPAEPELVKWASTVKGKLTTGSFADAARHGEIVVVAVHGTAALGVIEFAGPPAFAGKLVIDVTNPLEFPEGKPPTIFVGTTDSLSERIQRALPAARVVKAFNTVGSPQMVEPKVKGQPRLEMMIAGNDAAAKQQVTEILKSFGWSGTIDVGGIDGARWLEALVPLWLRVGTTLNRWDHVWVVARD